MVKIGNRSGAGAKAVFSLNAEPGKNVLLSGTFNRWDMRHGIVMKDQDGNGTYTCVLELEPGIYEYCFVVDGFLAADRENERFVFNEFGTRNSVFEI